MNAFIRYVTSSAVVMLAVAALRAADVKIDLSREQSNSRTRRRATKLRVVSGQ
jgi:hypothetical protein